jgi:hypothetical protein
MMAFKFRLEKVLQLKTSQARTEEFKLEALLRQRVQMQAEMDAADSSLLQSRKSIESATFSSSAELLAFEHYKVRAEKERQEAQRKLTAHDEAVEKQRSAVVAACNVTRWRTGDMVERWVASAWLLKEKHFRKVVGHRDLWTLALVLGRERKLNASAEAGGVT